ncbi:hypothetical protein EXW33_29555 (plasmid) [Bacillus toyonensis]|nr:hypothetical protein EXW33_29555 [Bacillus toyonensis]
MIEFISILSYSRIGRFNGIRITKIIKLFDKRMIQLNIEKACFDQSFFKARFFYLFFIKV